MSNFFDISRLKSKHERLSVVMAHLMRRGGHDITTQHWRKPEDQGKFAAQ